LGLKLGLDRVKKNWALNRCNPIYMPFADDLEQNFTYCIQTSVTNLSPFLLAPFMELIKSIAGIGKSNLFSINALRQSNSNFRNLLAFNFSGIIDSIGNLGISFQNNSLLVQDTVGKMAAVVMSIVYMIKATTATFESTWAGPPGQLLRTLESTGKKIALCFHPDTIIEVKNNRTGIPKSIKMKYCKEGDILNDGSRIIQKLLFYNVWDETLYQFKNNKNILVTSYHKVFSNNQNQFVYVCDHEDVVKTDISTRWLVTLITSSNRIFLSEWEFMDWEDD